MLEVRSLGLDGVCEIVTPRIQDQRGFFSETYNERDFVQMGIVSAFVQDNHSSSRKAGTLRGLHYQLPPFAQAKLVRVTRGAVLDIVVDIRRSSGTFGRWVAVELSRERWNQLFVPVGFAHGIVSLSDEAEVLYKVSRPYSPTHDRSLRYDDPQLAIDWRVPILEDALSEKDRGAPGLADAELLD